MASLLWKALVLQSLLLSWSAADDAGSASLSNENNISLPREVGEGATASREEVFSDTTHFPAPSSLIKMGTLSSPLREGLGNLGGITPLLGPRPLIHLADIVSSEKTTEDVAGRTLFKTFKKLTDLELALTLMTLIRAIINPDSNFSLIPGAPISDITGKLQNFLAPQRQQWKISSLLSGGGSMHKSDEMTSSRFTPAGEGNEELAEERSIVNPIDTVENRFETEESPHSFHRYSDSYESVVIPYENSNVYDENDLRSESSDVADGSQGVFLEHSGSPRESTPNERREDSNGKGTEKPSCHKAHPTTTTTTSNPIPSPPTTADTVAPVSSCSKSASTTVPPMETTYAPTTTSQTSTTTSQTCTTTSQTCTTTSQTCTTTSQTSTTTSQTSTTTSQTSTTTSQTSTSTSTTTSQTSTTTSQTSTTVPPTITVATVVPKVTSPPHTPKPHKECHATLAVEPTPTEVE